MLTITCEQMKAMDSYAINTIGIPSIVLMETAALRTVENIDTTLDKFTIICGVGNNGGDGLAIARILLVKEKNVEVFIVGNLDKGTKDFNINLEILKNMNTEIHHISDKEDLILLKNSIDKSDLTLDAIFGIGLTRNVDGIFKDVISTINSSSKNIYSIDIPSGIDGDTGQVLGSAVKANKTVTFHLMKKGLLNAPDYTGEIVVEGIGIPKIATETILKY
ncbi:NAD(P)H-hydrate epimerase [Tissierella creatinini]|nr:NAD(P)H-hydrate epimerase [Tissierella creatinini]TJX60114.1 NAD(P)H-hydrate epimerase [Soehngenia saccharolytica]